MIWVWRSLMLVGIVVLALATSVLVVLAAHPDFGTGGP